MELNNEKNKFYTEDDLTYSIVAPKLVQIMETFNYNTSISKTEDGDRIDATMTATKGKVKEDYSIEIKRREGNYTYSYFWNTEEKYPEDQTKGQFIKKKKIDILMQYAQKTRAYYCVYFPDDVIALWRINKDTKYGEVKKYYDLYNVERGEKQLQHNYTLSLHNASLIWDCKNNKPILMNKSTK